MMAHCDAYFPPNLSVDLSVYPAIEASPNRHRLIFECVVRKRGWSFIQIRRPALAKPCYLSWPVGRSCWLFNPWLSIEQMAAWLVLGCVSGGKHLLGSCAAQPDRMSDRVTPSPKNSSSKEILPCWKKKEYLP